MAIAVTSIACIEVTTAYTRKAIAAGVGAHKDLVQMYTPTGVHGWG